MLVLWLTGCRLPITGYKSYDHNWKPVEDLVQKLVDIVSKGGNYLLNVGPTAVGEIPQPSVERLAAMGAWLDANSAAIYGTRPGPLQGLEGYRTTVDPATGRIFLHVFDWPAGGRIAIPGLEQGVRGASLLVGGATLPVTGGEGGLVIQGPDEAPDAVDTVVVLDPKR